MIGNMTLMLLRFLLPVLLRAKAGLKSNQVRERGQIHTGITDSLAYAAGYFPGIEAGSHC